MIIGAHLLVYSQDAEADRVFFRDVLQFPNVDAGGGWLIFKLPVTEAALHPSERDADVMHSTLYLMCDDLVAEVAALRAKHVECGKVSKERWGLVTGLSLPSGGKIGLYQPLHQTALALQ